MTESWLSPDLSSGIFCPKGYNIVRFDRSSRGGGVCLFLHNSIQYNEVNIATEFNSIEVVCVDVKFASVCYRVICYYRSPGCGKDDIDYALLSCKLLRKLCSTEKHILLLGDFNLPDISWPYYHGPDNIINNSFLDFINSYGLSQLVATPTRGKNILDLLLTNVECNIADINVLPPIGYSDHAVVSFKILLDQIPTVGHTTSARNWKRADYQAICSEMSLVDWNDVFQYCFSTNDCWNSFCNIVNTMIDKFVPVFTFTNNSLNIGKKTYPRYIKNLIKGKAIAWKRWKTQETDTNEALYKQAEKDCSWAIKAYQSAKELQLLRRNNIGEFYKFINDKFSNNVKINNIKHTNGSFVNDDYMKCQVFNDFFASVFTQDNGETPAVTSRVPSSTKLSSISFTPQVVYSALKKLKPSTSVGPDGIPNIFLKNCSIALAVPLCHIYDTSFKNQQLPDVWKLANVVPVHKKGSKAEPNNYRPISLTSTCCRVMERIINKELLTYLEQNNLISEQQHGFRSGRSACTNLLEAASDWVSNVQTKVGSDIVYFDLSKAFDSVSHHKLNLKIQSYGLDGHLLQWITEFVNGRTQRVKIDSVLSSELPVTSGVPQGSVLGPTLFLLFINDATELFTDLDVQFKLFADDLKIYSSGNSDDLQLAINRFCAWCDVWQLNIATEKCNHIAIKNPQTTNFTIKTFTVNNITIERSSKARDLGVVIDESLKYSEHISQITRKAMVRCKLIFKSFESRDRSLLCRAYKIYVRPILEYCSSVWNPHHAYLIDKVEAVQRFFTKRLPGLWNVPYSERLLILGLQSLKDRRVQGDLKLCFKILNGYVSTSLRQCFTVASSSITRGHDRKLLKPYSSIEATKYFFANRVVDVWNALPNSTVTATSIGSFTHRLDLSFI